MVRSSRLSDDTEGCGFATCRAAPDRWRILSWASIVGVVLLVWAPVACAGDVVRLALWDAGLARKGPGLLLRDLGREDAQIDAVVEILNRVSADIVVLTNTDVDAGGVTLHALQDRLGYPHGFSRIGNAGLATGIDMDGDGRRNTARDAQGFGAFSGNGGIAVLAQDGFVPRLERDFSEMLWRDLPGNLLQPDTLPAGVAEIQRLSSTAHWVLRAGPLTLLVYAAAPPVFDGPEDRNGRRNHDETALWLRFLDGEFGPVPDGPLVLMGKVNADPEDGEGRREGLHTLLAHPRLQDPAPASVEAVADANPGHRGDPALDTADFDDPTPGNLRVDYILPSSDLDVLQAGVIWPAPGSVAQTASRHGLVFVTLRLSGPAREPSVPTR